MRRPITHVYHLVDERNWAAVQAHGLLSAEHLAMQAGSNVAALSAHRPDNLVLPSGVIIRDQKPMPPKILAACLQDGLKPDDWYRLLNSKVFFWIDPDRLNRQRRACGAAPQRILVIDAERLLSRHGARAFVTPINTGNAMRAAAARGLTTFVPYKRWINDGWAYEQIGRSNPRPSSHRPVELTIDGEVPDILDVVQSSVLLQPGEAFDGDDSAHNRKTPATSNNAPRL